MSIITDCPYICAPNIMDTPGYTTKTVVLDMTGKTVIKAGTPISADGKVANDETAIGILLQDCHACLGTRRGLVVISGRIKQDVAKDHSGVTISDEAKAAMINVTFTGDGARSVKPDALAGLNTAIPIAKKQDSVVLQFKPYSASNKTIDLERPDIEVGKEYTFAIVSSFSNVANADAYSGVELQVSSVAKAVTDRYGNVAYNFSFQDVSLITNKDGTGSHATLTSITFNESYVSVMASFRLSAFNGTTNILIATDIPDNEAAKTGCTGILMFSATEGSTKLFKITVNDSGELSATEVTE